MVTIIIVIIVLIVILPIIKSPNSKGKRGEERVTRILEKLPNTQYRLINNLMLNTPYGTTQIDHIVISLYGIFVIETKNYTGWIIGNQYAEYWTQNLYGKKYQFNNPLKQNYGHIISLTQKLNIPQNVFISIIAFSNQAELKTQTNEAVLNFRNIYDKIINFCIPIFSEAQILNMEAFLLTQNVYSKEIESIHIENVQNKAENKKLQIQNNICSRCGGQLIVRKGRYGSFKGCSNYPKCRFTNNI